MQDIETVKRDCKHADCRYRGTFANQPSCLYMMMTGRRRGCSISECDKFEPGRIEITSRLDGFKYDI